MSSLNRWAVLSLLLAGAFFAAGCNQLKARDQLNKGVRAYKSAQFNVAAEHFKNAVRLDPSLLTARLYLATSYQTQFTPGNPSADNLRYGHQAVRVYKAILKLQPNNANALAGIASIYFGMGRYAHARKYYNLQIQRDPNDPVPYYTIGVIDWNQSYRPRITTRLKYGITNAQAPFVGPHTARQIVRACKNLASTAMPKVEDGLQMLHKAMELRQNYINAMDYLNLLYREKADLECGNRAASRQAVAKANKWFNQALVLSRAQAKAKSKASAAQ